MAVTTKTFGERSGSSRVWTFGSSGDIAETFGHTLTLFADVDTAASDTVTIKGSPDNITWFDIGTYNADTVIEIVAVPYVKASWSQNSHVFVYGLQRR